MEKPAVDRLDRRDLRFVLVCLLVIAGGAAVTAALFRRAFPEAAIEFRVDREGARRAGERVLAERGRDVKGSRFAAQFTVEENPKVYLERELGLERASGLYGRDAKIWLWQMRWFRSGQLEEERVAISPLGDLVGFRSMIREDAPGAKLTEAEARRIALAYLASRGLSEASLKPIEAAPVARPKRTDWSFVDEKAGVKFADATIRYETTVSGDRLTRYRETVHVPESWMRDYERLRAKNNAAGQVASAAFLVTVIAMLIVLVSKIVHKDVPWRLVAAFGAVAFLLALLSGLNELPLTLFEYDTASPLSAYLTRQVVLGVLAAIATAAGIALVVAAAEPIYRERFPQHASLGGAFSPRGIQTKGFFRAVLLGYALAAFFFAYQAVFYVVAARFGAWAPADVPYSDMLNTALPWATVLFIGFLPAVSEEGISRMFSISLLDRLGAWRWVAVVVPAFIWGFGHSTYPNQPFFIRGLEVGTAGVLIGFLMLRFGVVPLLVWHFTVDAIYTALVLLRSGNAYYVVSGAIAAGILLLPLAISLVLYVRRGGFLPAGGLSNADAGTVVPPSLGTVVRAPAPVPPVEAIPRGALGVMGGIAVILFASLFVPSRADDTLVEDRVGRARALEMAERFLRVNGADPAAWRSVAYEGTGFSDDEELRGAKPQDNAGIPGFSEAAARYVIEHGGADAFRRLAERNLPPAWWVARFYRPESKEEWKVLIDARRDRVAAFVHPLPEDAPAGPPVAEAAARRRAMAAAELLGYPSAEYTVLEVGTETRPKRVDTTVVLQAVPKGIGEARPRLTAVFHGSSLAAFLPSLHVPESFLRQERSQSSFEWLLMAVRIVAAGALVGAGVILFLRIVRQDGFRWRAVRKPVIWAGVVAAAGLLNTVPYLFRQYQTQMPMSLFRLGLGVGIGVGLLVIVLGAAIAFVLIDGARPGWARAMRRKGSVADAFLRAAIAAGGMIGLSRWFHVVSSRVPSLYDPDPSLPSSLQFASPAVDVLWTAGRGALVLAALAATAALAARSAFFRTTRGRMLGFAALAVALLPSSLTTAGGFVADYLPSLLGAAWLAASAFLLLRDHAAAWVLFALVAMGGRGAVELLAQPAAPDRSAGGLAVMLLAAAGVALLAGRRDRDELEPIAVPGPPLPELPIHPATETGGHISHS
jgi:hypothetical protein